MAKRQHITNLNVLKDLKVKLNDVVTLSKVQAAKAPSRREVTRRCDSRLREIKLKYALEEAKEDMKYLERHLFDGAAPPRRVVAKSPKRTSRSRKKSSTLKNQSGSATPEMKYIEDGYDDEWL